MCCLHNYHFFFLFHVVVTIGNHIWVKSRFDNLYKHLICLICMRWAVLILLGIFLVSFASADIPGDCDRDGDMIAYWRMENNILDSVGPYDDGTDSGVVYNINPTGVGQVANFDGTDTISVPGDSFAFQSSFTIEMLVRTSFDVTTLSSLFKKGAYELSILDGDLVGSVGSTQVTSPAAINPVTTYHVALSWGASSDKKLKLYINGVEVDSVDMADTLGISSNGPLVIGKDFVGYIDEVALYDEALTGSAIFRHRSLVSSGVDYCDTLGSIIDTSFTVDGCDITTWRGDTIGVAYDTCSPEINGDYKGYFYCDRVDGGIETGNWSSNPSWLPTRGCSMGKAAYDPADNVGNLTYCCPDGKICVGDIADGWECITKTDLQPCVEKLDKDACLETASQCIWLNDTIPNRCVDSFEDLPCDYYTTETDCDGDPYNLGEVGVGTQDGTCDGIGVCGDPAEEFVLNCACKWNDTADTGKECYLNKRARSNYDDAMIDYKEFSCNSNYVLGECIDGKQDSNWTAFANMEFETTFGGSVIVPDSCLSMLNCRDGDGVRFCGEPIVKLPGFSLFALLTSLFILGLYYIKRDEKI